jgi:RHS repeat-associated protein
LVPDTKWALSDHQGTIKDIADFNPTTGQTSVRHRAYDSFGNRKGSALTTDIVFGYTGKYFDETTGLQNSWNRWYSPKMGRFISQDPIGFAGGDANMYRYVGNSSPNATDPSGLKIIIPLSEGERLYNRLQSAPFYKDLVVERSEDMAISLPNNYKFSSRNIKEEIYLAMLKANREVSHNSLQSLEHEVFVRMNIVWYAENSRIQFPQGPLGKAVFDPRHFRLDPKNPDQGHIVTSADPGVAVDALLLGGQSTLGCLKAIKLTMMAGIASATRKLKVKPEYQLRNELQPHEVDGSKFVSDIASMGDFIPGDWGYIANPAYVDGVSGHGDAGHNFIYVGWGLESLWGASMSIEKRIKEMNDQYKTECVLSPNVGVPNPAIFQ